MVVWARIRRKYALDSGRIGGATQLAKQSASAIHIQRAGRWNSASYMVYVRTDEEGSDHVSQAPMRGMRKCSKIAAEHQAVRWSKNMKEVRGNGEA